MAMSAKVKRDPRFRRVQIPKNATASTFKVVLRSLIDQLDVEDNERPAKIVIKNEWLAIVFRDKEAGVDAGSLQGDETA
jgi:hypothetical protein